MININWCQFINNLRLRAELLALFNSAYETGFSENPDSIGLPEAGPEVWANELVLGIHSFFSAMALGQDLWLCPKACRLYP